MIHASYNGKFLSNFFATGHKTLLSLHNDLKWFNLANYQPSAKFSALDWMDQIVKRANIKDALNKKDQSTLDMTIPALMNNPLRQELEHREIFEEMRHKQNPAPVRPLTFDDIKRLTEVLGPFAIKASPGESIENVVLRHSEHGQALLLNAGYLVIGLEGKNEEIIEGVRAWLKQRRGFTSSEQERNEGAKLLSHQGLQTQFDRWFDAKLLPYFDLIAWRQWSNMHLSNEALISLLYPNAPAKEQSVLRKTKELVPQIITSETAIELLASYLRGG